MEKMEDGSQKTEDGRRKAEDRGQGAEDGGWRAASRDMERLPPGISVIT